MNTKGKNSKDSDPGKAVTRTDLESDDEMNESQNIIPSDNIIAEKDEVKNAEERLRLKKEDEAKGKGEK